jgi:uncharacterized protein (DUF362 family)
MTVANLQSYLDELVAEDKKFDAQVVATFKKKAEDWLGVSEAEWKFLAEKVLGEQGHRFVDEATRQDFGRFLVSEMKSRHAPWDPFLDFLASIPGLSNLLVEATLGQVWMIFKDGKAPPEVIQKVREEASQINFRGTVSLAKIDPQAGTAEIEAALRKTIHAIGGFDFLSRPPQGKTKNEHTILIKVGVNWGQLGYPTVTSCESVSALTKMCFQEAKSRGASVEVIVGDESGIEIALWGGTTMDNFQHTGILHAAVLAGLERAASLEGPGPGEFAGARELLELARSGHEVTLDPGDTDSVKMMEMARRAGVQVVPFDEVKNKAIIPVPGARHFQQGIRVPGIVAGEVTDIINLPKPPGRHLIMGNTGLTGALKNHVGILVGSFRSPGLHGLSDRYPAAKEGLPPESCLESLKVQVKAIKDDGSGKEARKFALDVLSNWRTFAPDMPFHEKITELYMAVAEKERFSVADMRSTVSSLGPDVGDTIDIGAVIAAKDPLTLDVFAGALLKRAYVEMGNAFAALEPGGDTLLEYLVGKTWLKSGTPFDLMSYIAANSYGVGPIDLAHIDLKGVENSGFSAAEMEAITSYLRGEQ